MAKKDMARELIRDFTNRANDETQSTGKWDENKYQLWVIAHTLWYWMYRELLMRKAKDMTPSQPERCTPIADSPIVPKPKSKLK